MAKLKCPNPVTNRMYGLAFTAGISEEVEDQDLINRLVLKGYEIVEEKPKTTKKKAEAE